MESSKAYTVHAKYTYFSNLATAAVFLACTQLTRVLLLFITPTTIHQTTTYTQHHEEEQSSGENDGISIETTTKKYRK